MEHRDQGQGWNRRAFLAKTARAASMGAVSPLLAGCAAHAASMSAVRIGADAPPLYAVETAFTKSYLLPCRGGYLLIDTSYPDEYAHFLAGLQALGIKPDQIQYLLLTHHHDDHAGFAAQLVKDTRTRVIVHALALPYLQGGRSEEASRPVNACVGCLVGLFALGHAFTFPPLIITEKDIVITGDDDAVLHAIGIAGEILYTPGHTDDSISVVLADGRAIVGDVAMNFMNYCGTRHRPIYVSDMGQVYASWQKLIAHGARHIYPAHGNPFDARELIIPPRSERMHTKHRKEENR